MLMPEWPDDLLAKYQGQQVVVSAVIGSEGRIAEIKVLQSPDPRLAEMLIAALKTWVFRPAVMNGKPAALKALLAAPIPSPRPR